MKKKEWYAEGKEIVKGVVSLTKKGYGPNGTGFGSEWSFDLDELARVTNGHTEFIGEVKKFLEKDSDSIYNAVVYRTVYKDESKEPHISLVCDVADIYIKLISCSINHSNGEPYVLSTSYNKSYVWQMASML